MKNQKLKTLISLIFIVYSNTFFAVKKQKFTRNQTQSIRQQLVKAGYGNFDDLSKLSVTLSNQKISKKVIKKSVDQAYKDFVLALNALGSNLDTLVMHKHLPAVIQIIETCSNKFLRIKKI